jgi:DNA-binding protein YbaB
MNLSLQRAKFRIGRPAASFLVLIAAALLAVSCSHEGAPSGSSASASPAVPVQTPAAPTAADLLSKAQTAAQQMKKYAFQLELTQHLSGEGEGGNSSVNVNMQGRAELGPLKLDQTIKSDIDGEVSSLRAILMPDAYYMYDQQFEEWSKLSKEQTKDIVKTLSDLQVNPAKSLEQIHALGSGLKAQQNGETYSIGYDGNGAEAKAFLDNVLESTLDLSGMDPKIRGSIKLDSLHVELVLDAAHQWPLSYRIDSVMTVEYEPGKPSTLEQIISGTYTHHNASAAVVIPKEAKQAPELDAPLD